MAGHFHSLDAALYVSLVVAAVRECWGATTVVSHRGERRGCHHSGVREECWGFQYCCVTERGTLGFHLCGVTDRGTLELPHCGVIESETLGLPPLCCHREGNAGAAPLLPCPQWFYQNQVLPHGDTKAEPKGENCKRG